jgi:hypothetical protein
MKVLEKCVRVGLRSHALGRTCLCTQRPELRSSNRMPNHSRKMATLKNMGFNTDFDHRLRDGGLTADLLTSDIWLLLTPDGLQLEYLFTTNEGNQTYHQVDTSGGLVSERGHWRIEAGELVVSVHEFVDEKIDPPQEFEFV